jgi:hypothetical protein
MDNNCKDPPSADSTSKTWSKIMSRPNIIQQKGKNKYVTKASCHHLTGTEVPIERKPVIMMMTIIRFQKPRMER